MTINNHAGNERLSPWASRVMTSIRAAEGVLRRLPEQLAGVESAQAQRSLLSFAHVDVQTRQNAHRDSCVFQAKAWHKQAQREMANPKGREGTPEEQEDEIAARMQAIEEEIERIQQEATEVDVERARQARA